ncbi:MAG TPA: hypothetical protein VFZ31_05320 [Vicinamibacterales bacterium]
MRNGLRAVLFCAVMAIVWSNTGVGAAPPTTRSFASARFALEIGGTIVGFVNAVEGGLAFGSVVKVAGEDYFFKKHLGNLGFRDIRLEFGADMEESLYQSISLALQGQQVRLSGAILSADFNGDVRRRLEFQEAQITEVTFPALDATSKDTAKMSIVLSPEHTSVNRKASGKLNVTSAKSQKRWLPANFRLSIDGIDTTKVSKVEALTVKLPRNTFGECRLCENLPGPTKVDFPDLVMTTGEPADALYDWFEAFAIQGNNDEASEKSGALEYLSSDLKTVLFTLNFKNLGIFELAPIGPDAAGSTVPKLLATMYCEKMDFVVP